MVLTVKLEDGRERPHSERLKLVSVKTADDSEDDDEDDEEDD